MKQIIVKVTMLLAVFIMSAKAFAYDFEVDGIYYNILSDTRCEVTFKKHGDSNYEGSVTIPEQVTYDGITRMVTAIGAYAFNACKNLTSVNIPNSVTVIGNCAFQACTNLTKVDMGNSVSTIGNDAFRSSGLTYINIPKSVTAIGEAAFFSCTGLRDPNLRIPNSVTIIGDYAFKFTQISNLIIEDGNNDLEIGYDAFDDYGGSNIIKLYLGRNLKQGSSPFFRGALQNVTIGNTVTRINDSAFSGCTWIRSIDIGNSVTSIGSYAFSGCEYHLTGIKIPNSVTTIGDYAFKECNSLNSLTFEDGTENLVVNLNAFEDCTIEQLYLGRNLTCQESSSPPLSNLTTLADVTIGSLVADVTAIDWTKNENLKSFHLLSPTPPTSNSFSSNQYENVTVLVPTGSLSAYQADAIWKNFWLLQESEDDTDIPEEDENIWKDGLAYKILSETTCEVIPHYDQSGQRVLYEGNIIIPEHITYEGQTMTVTAIGESAFSQCTELRSVEIPNTITEIGNNAFADCANLLGIDLPNSVFSIGEGAFMGCSSLTSIDIPNSITNIKHETFSGCTSLMSANIPNSVAIIGSYAFSGCSYLLSVNIPNSVATIDEGAFYDCSEITSVFIPSSVTTIGASAFKDCPIKSLVIEEGENTLDINLNGNAFDGCPVETLHMGRNVNGTLNFKNLSDLIISNSVTEIGLDQFGNCTSLASLTIPSSITTIYSTAFFSCSNLKELVLEDGIRNLEVSSDAFGNCPIEQLYLGRNLTCIESSSTSLYNLTTLADVTIGGLVADVTAIDWTKNENLTSIKSLAAAPPTSERFTNPQYMNVKVSVPFGSLSSYKEDIVWRNFWNLQEDEGTGVNHVEANERQSIKTENGHIIVENAQGHIRVYDMAGHLVKSTQTDGGRVEISAPQHGMYIVKVGGKSVKVTL